MRIFFLAILSLLSIAVNAQVGVRNITQSNGLLSNGVRCVTQSEQGFLWFGTDNGLCRFDGMMVKPYRIEELNDEQFVSVVVPSGKSIYVGTGHGVYILDLLTEQFKHLDGKLNTEITSMVFDSDGSLWISSTTQGVFRYSPKSGKMDQIAFAGANTKNVGITQVYVDRDNQVWALTYSGFKDVWRLNKSTGTFYPYNVKSSIPDVGAYRIIETQDGTHWLATWTHGLARLADDGTLTVVTPPIRHIHCIYEVSPNHLLMGCDDGIMEYNPQSVPAFKEFGQSLFMTPGQNISTPKFVYSIISDTEGGIWFSSFYGGVSYVSPVGSIFHSFYFSNTQGLLGQVISHFCEDGQGRIWLASDDGGLASYNPSTRKVTPASAPLSTDLNVHALCMDGNDMWIGTYSSGIYIMNTAGGGVRHIDDQYAPRDCYALYKDHKNRMWIATMTGIMYYDLSAKKFVQVKELGSMVIDIDEDATGTLWFSSQSQGLLCLMPNGKWKQYVNKKGDDKSIPSNQVNCMRIASDGKIYVGTGSGLCLFQPKNGTFQPVHFNSPAKNIAGIVEIQGTLWLSTDQGIIKYTAADGIQTYNRYDGLGTEQFLPNSVLLASDGALYYGSVHGFCTFYPYQVKTNKNEPNVFITSLEIYNKLVEVGSDKLPRALTEIDELSLDHDDGMFSLTFAALSYCSPEKNQYAYRLEGFDKDWIYVGSNNKATYTNLPAGTYTFHVKATNNDGVWSSHEATLKIVVHPPFWWSIPAKIFYLLLIGAFLYFFMHERLRRANDEHQKEMDQLKEKQKLEVQQARLAFFTMIAHEIRTPVSLIIAPLEQLQKKMADCKNHEDGQKLLSVIDRNAHRLLDLVNQLLDFNKMQHKGLEVHFKKTNVRQLMQSVVERFSLVFQNKGLKFDVEYPDPEFYAVVDPEGITKVISNFLTNANKYTKDYVKLSCTAKKDDTSFTITVEDNGVGISADEQKKIFDPFYQARDNKPGTGIGLNIVKNIVDFHHGEVGVDSEPGKGSKFYVKLNSHQMLTIHEDEYTPVEIDDENAGGASKIDDATSVNAVVSTDNAETVEMSDNDEQTLLIVEDNPDMLEFLSANLSSTYKVLTAENGREALDVLRHNHVTLIVSDWMMPEMDGATLCRRIRSDVNTSHIPFIMLTAKTDDESKTEGMQCGADTYIEKPFSVKYLEAAITNMIELRRTLFLRFSGTPDAPITEMTTNSVDDEFLGRLNTIIEDNVTNADLNVAFLSEQLCLSRSSLFSKIKSLTGTTPNELIQTIRLKRAAKLLAQKKYRINEVCYMVGFSNPSYFTKCFSKQFGKKPAEYVASL